ncbi:MULTISPECIES: polysaccharide pyruvyl transferase family protein [Clostridium]|uniref:AMSJ/WSAK related protein n=1 Tax=Clostridium disporicum TaxID=84024 RepID=A0A174IA71_9CLOT|nr:polysaccharide pyruvyl transferase family protein [Clostridium disporicum]CUO84083.1 AMSJ/WSAK related protein [Clostridium disporicum]
MKKVILRGFFYENLGDDLFYHMIVKRYPKTKFYLPVIDKCKRAYSDEKNVKIISLNKVVRGINRVFSNISSKFNIYNFLEKHGDLVVLIGGSLFQEKANDGSDIERLNEMPGRKKPLYILGVNFGPYKTQRYLEKSKEYLLKAKDVCFRDESSYGLFKELNNTRVATDIIFGIEKLIPANKINPKLCVISVIDFSRNAALLKYKQAYLKFIVKSIEKYSNMGYTVMLVSFCKIEGDEDAIEEIIEMCDESYKDKVKTYLYKGENWKETVELMSSASYIIATRFHSMILGLVYGIPTLPIIYNEKSLNILHDLKCEDCCVKLEELESYDLNKIRFAKADNINEVKVKSIEQFKVLDNLLK